MLLGTGGGSFVCIGHCCRLSVPSGEQASEKRWDYSLRPVPQAPKVLQHQMVQRCAMGHGVPEVMTQAMRMTAVLLFSTDKYAMFSFAMKGSLASNSDKFKIITLHQAQKFGDTGQYTNFSFNPLVTRNYLQFQLKSDVCKMNSGPKQANRIVAKLLVTTLQLHQCIPLS